jgi:hypothetical protein
MRIDILTLFPAMFEGPLTESILRRAQDEEKIEIHFHDIRSFGIGKYHQVDDTPYGGGAGMVMRVDVLSGAIDQITEMGKADLMNPKAKPYRIYFSPRGKRLKQAMVEKIAKKQSWLILLCGHYEGIDQRIIDGGWIGLDRCSGAPYSRRAWTRRICGRRKFQPRTRTQKGISALHETTGISGHESAGCVDGRTSCEY